MFKINSLLILFAFLIIQIKISGLNTPSLNPIYNKTIDIVVVGGGEAGCHTAIALAKEKTSEGLPLYKITIIEKNKELLLGTSRITPGRLGQGYHYSHIDTALTYLKESMSFMKKYPNCIVGKDFKKNHPLRRGRYVVMKESNPTPFKVWKVYQEIQKRYSDLVNTNCENKIWGEPNDFLKLLYLAGDQTWINAGDLFQDTENSTNKIALEKIIDLKNVAFVVETQEELLDWQAYRKEVLNELTQFDNITVLTEMEAVKLLHMGGQNFSIVCKNADNELSYLNAHFPVICAWEHSEKIVRTLNITSDFKDVVTNRLKCIVTIKLPPAMQDKNCYFFCMGPYAMFSNLGNGYGKITYAPITNRQKIDAADGLSNDMQDLLNKEHALDDKKLIANSILKGVQDFIPALSNICSNDIVDIGFGIVKTMGSKDEINIYDPLGKIGERDYGWVRTHEVNNGEAIIIENNAMKIVYGLKNAQETLQIIGERIK
jgi:hypothetical protein